MAAAETRSASARGTGGAWSAVGGLLIVLGYWLPWITYHIESEARNVTDNGWQALFGPDGVHPVLGSFFSDGIEIYYSAGMLLAITALLPFAVGLIAMVAGARRMRFTAAHRLTAHWTPCWSLVIAGVLALLFLTYTLDPFGRNPETYWVLRHDLLPPTIGPGLYTVFIGMAAVVGGALISHHTR